MDNIKKVAFRVFVSIMMIPVCLWATVMEVVKVWSGKYDQELDN